MRVLYDYQILLRQAYGGISRYYYEIINKISSQKECEAHIHCLFSVNKYFENYFHRKANNFNISKKPFFHRLNKILYCTYLLFGKYDIFHPTYYEPYFLKYNKGKLIITVYDMIHELFPELYNKADPTVKNKKKLIYAADHIIAISESTKQDILKIYPDISAGKISVIYIGSSLKKEVDKKNREYNFPERYILFVGKRGDYKNFERFLSAYKKISERDGELYLLCIGGGDFDESEKKKIGSLSERIVRVDADDSKLSYAYSNALCFVFPSLYEGFGIPILEAFACGCPVALSNVSSFPEVGGEAAIYFNPYDIDDMVEKIETVIYNCNLRKILRKKEELQLNKFNWSVITKQIVNCYEKVLDCT